MNLQRLFAALAFALACSALLTWQLSKHIVHASPSAGHAAPSREVVVATHDIRTGERLTASSLTVVRWPVSLQFSGSFARPQDIIGRELLAPVSAGEPLVEHDLAGKDVDSISASVPDGMRAVSIRMSDEAAGLSGLITVGSYLDILVSYRSDADATYVSTMVLQDVRVLLLGKKGAPEADAQHHADETLTLLLTPDEAARLAVAGSLGKLTFVLRNRTDKSLSTDLSHVILTPPGAAPAHASGKSPARSEKSSGQSAGNGFSIETLSGGKSTVQTFQAGQP